MNSKYNIRYSQLYTIHENQIIFDTPSVDAARYYRLPVANLTQGKLIVKNNRDDVDIDFDVTYSSTVLLPQPTDAGSTHQSGKNSVEMVISDAAMNQHEYLYIQVYSCVDCGYSIEFVTDTNMQQILEHGV